MAKFNQQHLKLKDDKRVYFGTSDDSSIYWDGADLQVTTTLSGVTPTAAGHLSTKAYVDALSFLSNIVEDTTPQLGGDLDTNNFSIEIDAVPGSDHEATGTITTMTAGENLVFGDVCYVKSDGKLWKTDANDSATMPVFAMAIASISADAAGQFLLDGFVNDASYAWTVGATIFASETAGAVTETAPTTAGVQIQVLGVATNAVRFYFRPNFAVGEV